MMISPSVIDEVAAERRRQIDAEGFSEECDDGYLNFDLPKAAAAYAIAACYDETHTPNVGLCPPQCWPWAEEWWKPKSPRENLIRAAALIIAEIERLDRAQKKIDPQFHRAAVEAGYADLPGYVAQHKPQAKAESPTLESLVARIEALEKMAHPPAAQGEKE